MCPCVPGEVVQYEKPTECLTVGVDAYPLSPPPPPLKIPGIPDHLQRILNKYPYNWRIDQLSKQVLRKRRSKYIGPPQPPLKKTPIYDPELEFFADHMSRPPLRLLGINQITGGNMLREYRLLVTNKRMFGNIVSKRRRKYFDQIIKKSWGSIYNYYKKKERDKKLRALRAQQDKKKEKSQKGDKDIEAAAKRLEELAQPKKVFLPVKKEPKKKKKTWKECTDCEVHLEILASPKPREEVPEKPLGWVSRKALKYHPTENVLKLATQFKRFTLILPPLELGKVHKNALRYKITPRTEELAVPKKRSEKEVEDSEWDPWAISKNALKYKPTPRILELAKPKERD